MYGTVARLRAKAGQEAEFEKLLERLESEPVAGFIGSYLYRLDEDLREYYFVVLFESREAYIANAESAEQHARYLQMIELLEGEPEWHDGSLAFAVRQQR